MTTIKIDAKQLAILCAVHFCANFDRADLSEKLYKSDYESYLEGILFATTVEAKFDDKLQFVETFRFGIHAPCADGKIEIVGSVEKAKLRAVEIINEYLLNYNVRIENVA